MLTPQAAMVICSSRRRAVARSARVSRSRKTTMLEVGSTPQANELAEIEVERKQNSIFRGGFRKHLGIGKALQPVLAQVGHLMTGVAEPSDDARAHAHVGEKSHRAPSAQCTSSVVNQAAHSSACCTSPASRSG